MPSWLKRGLVVCLWLAIWQLAAYVIDNEILLASPLKTLLVLAEGLATPRYWAAIGASMLRIGLGFCLAFCLALALGTLAWRWPLFAELLNPAITFMKSVPVVCFIVMLLIWFGARWVALTAVLLVALPAFYFAVLEGLGARDEAMSEMLTVYQVPAARRLAAYHWPTILPFISAAAKSAVGMSWKSGVAAELIGLPLGSIGEGIYRAKILLDSAEVFAWTLIVVALSVLAEAAFIRLLEASGGWSWRLALPSWPEGGSSRGKPAAPSPITAEGLAKGYEGKSVLSGLSLQLEPGSRHALNTPSGSGKTTLLRLLAGLEKPDAGSLVNPNRASMVFQEARLFEQRSAVENIRLVAGALRDEADVRSTLGCLLPEDSLDLPVSQLSGGMRRRVELCRALLAPSQLLLLDEPFAGLDMANTAMAQELLLSLLDGRTLVFASHDEADAEYLSAGFLSLYS